MSSYGILGSAGQTAQKSGYVGALTEDEWMHPWTITGFLYHYFLGNDLDKENAMRLTSVDVLKQAVNYVQDDDLKRTMYASIREIASRGKHRNSSIIVNEMLGIYEFAKGAASYAYWTAKMYL